MSQDIYSSREPFLYWIITVSEGSLQLDTKVDEINATRVSEYKVENTTFDVVL